MTTVVVTKAEDDNTAASTPASTDDTATQPAETDAKPSTPALTEEAIRRMRIKDLRRALWERGVECLGCTQKEDLLNRLLENKDLPVIKDDASEAKEKADAETLSYNGPHSNC